MVRTAMSQVPAVSCIQVPTLETVEGDPAVAEEREAQRTEAAGGGRSRVEVEFQKRWWE